MVRIGIVGVGFMGMTHYLAYRQVKGAKVRAICTRDSNKLAGDWRGIKGNFGPPGEVMDLTGVRGYSDWQDLLRDPEIDLVDVCLPPALHAEVACAAAAAGKHVLCEKPIALAMADGQRMVAAAKKAGRLLMIAQVLPFFPEYRFALQVAASGKFGKPLGGHFKRVIADPLWIEDFFDPRGAGGPVVDLHIHDAHFLRLLCGQPRAVFSTGRMRGEAVEFVNTQFLFADPAVTASAQSGVIRQQGRAFTHAFEIYFEKATLTYDLAGVGDPPAGTPLTVMDSKGKTYCPPLKPVDAFVAELTEAVKAVKTGRPSALLAGGLALDALTLCHREQQSVRQGKLVKV